MIDGLTPQTSLDTALAAKLAAIRSELLDEYRLPHGYPWVIGYSGGKDSSLVVHLVFELLLTLAPSERRRPVRIVANNTLVESPLVIRHIEKMFERFQLAIDAFDLRIKLDITRPAADNTFWVNLIGRGYPSPTRSFRWCTDRMKILPTSQCIRSQASEVGRVILLLGVRRSESAARAARVDGYTRKGNGQRLNPHNDLAGCLVFRPIVDLDTDEVWELLGTLAPPLGGDYKELIQLYRNAQGGECPVVTQKSDVPSCGTSSSRFGCWTCTVVVKDRSLEGFIEAGFTQFEPLIRFREWLVQIRDEPGRRMLRRRNGRVTHLDNGSLVHGPFTMATRREVLERLLDLQREVGSMLVTEEEIEIIRRIWADDVASGIERSVRERDQARVE